jgi:hypothetical protein
MRKIVPTAAFAACMFLISCKKETSELKTIQTPEASSVTAAKQSAVTFKSQQTFQEPGAFWNDCTQELMNYHGNVHMVVEGVINKNKISSVEHINYNNLYAVGENSNVAYRGSVNQNVSSSTSNDDGSFTYTGQLSLKFVSPGGKNNFVQKIFYHITINANGETTSEIDKANYGSCQ